MQNELKKEDEIEFKMYWQLSKIQRLKEEVIQKVKEHENFALKILVIKGYISFIM